MSVGSAPVFEEVDPRDAPALACLERYYDELRERFEEGFDVARSVAATPDDFVRPRGVFLVMSIEGRAAGCGGVIRTSPEVGYIKRMWVDTSLRGRGLGRTLLAALEEAARGLGCDTAQLETHRSLTGALALYRTSGYREVAPFNGEFYADHWFEKALVPPQGTG